MDIIIAADDALGMAIPPEPARAILARRQNAPVAAALAKVGRAKSKPG